MKSTSSTKEIEQPKVCGCCNISIKTCSIIFGILMVIQSVGYFSSERFQKGASELGEYGYVIYALIYIIAAGIYFGVGFTDKVECSQAAKFYLYGLTLMNIGLIVYFISKYCTIINQQMVTFTSE
jgi:predicted membrane protein